jgi:hypothetical protein
MRSVADAVYAIAITLWVGGLWAVGYVAAPVLFRTLADRALAGEIAGSLFAVIAWVGIGCAAYLLLFLLVRRGAAALRSSVFWVVIAMLALVAAGHFGIQPIMAQLKAQAIMSGARGVMESVMRDRFATWHGVSSVLYLMQSALGLALVLLQNRGR